MAQHRSGAHQQLSPSVAMAILRRELLQVLLIFSDSINIAPLRAAAASAFQARIGCDSQVGVSRTGVSAGTGKCLTR